jgi:prepilin-type N-terminal cleavage/methylation domain-containing protein
MYTRLKQGLSIIEILIAISLIAIAMLGVTGFIQTQNMGSMKLSISAKNISAQRYLEKLIWAEYIEVPRADINCRFKPTTTDLNDNVTQTVTQIGLGANKKCTQINSSLAQADLDEINALANIYPISCSLNGTQLICRTTALNTKELTLVKNTLQSNPIFSNAIETTCTNYEVTNNDKNVLQATCTLQNLKTNSELLIYLIIFQKNLNNSSSDGFFKYYYPDICHQNSSSCIK